MTDELPEARVRPASNWSAVWVLPLIALLIGAWLGWRAYEGAGVNIQVRFESGEGIEVGKTHVIFKGMTIGKVVDMSLEEGDARRNVLVTLEMNKDAENFRRQGARFWLVKPDISLAGVSGLDTLVSGNYIGAFPGSGDPRDRFNALSEPPPLPDSVPGLHLTLQADRLGSLDRDSPIFYRQIQVGRVKSYALADDHQTIDVKVYIQPAYANLVRKNSRFWNASGVSIDASLSGVKIRSESLASVVAGGIAFSNPDGNEDAPPPEAGQRFRLYEDYEAAQAGVRINLALSDFDGLQPGRTPVMYKGLQVGTLQRLNVDGDLRGARAELTIDPLMEGYLVEGTDFWVVRPSISLAGITGLEALVKGNYIAVRPGEKDAPATRDFTARLKAPPLDLGAPGLHMVLVADGLGSLDIGSPVLYRQVKVGSVQSYQFARDNRHVLLGVHIEPNYAHLVNSSSRFWNASGIRISGGLSGLDVQSESLQSLLAGGVAFETPDLAAAKGQRIPSYDLYQDRDSALRSGTPIEIRLTDGEGLEAGAPIRYKGMQVGRIDSLALADDLGMVIARAHLDVAGERLAREGTRFWVVKPELGLVRTENLQTLVSGRFLAVRPGPENAPRKTAFSALGDAPGAEQSEPGLRLTLSAERLGSLKAGVPVSFREVKVGQVLGTRLGPTSDRVLIDVLIEPRYAKLVHTGSRFWNASGFGFDFGLIRGASVRTESLEALLEGGIAFATPEGEAMGRAALPGQTFALFDEANEQWLQWAPKIPLD